MNSLFFISAKALSLLVVFFCTAFIARKLGPVEFGLFSEIKLYISVVFVISVFGNDAYVISSMSSSGDNKQKVTVILLARVVLFLTLSFPIMIIMNSEFFFSVFLIYLFQLLNLGFLAFSATCQGRRYFVFCFFSFFLTALVVLIFSFYDFYLYLYYIPFYYFLLFLITFKVFCSEIVKIDFFIFLDELKVLISDVWPLIVSSVIVFIYTRVDFFIISQFLTSKELGVYSVAVQLSEPFSFIASAYAMSVISSLNKMRVPSLGKEKFISDKLKVLHFLVLIIIVFYFLFGELIIQVFFGALYINSYEILMLLMVSKFFVFSNLFFSVVMVVESNYIARLKRICISLVVAIVLSLILIPQYGLFGAALSVIVSQFISVTVVNALSIKTRDYCTMFIRSIIIWK